MQYHPGGDYFDGLNFKNCDAVGFLVGPVPLFPYAHVFLYFDLIHCCLYFISVYLNYTLRRIMFEEK